LSCHGLEHTSRCLRQMRDYVYELMRAAQTQILVHIFVHVAHNLETRYAYRVRVVRLAREKLDHG